MKESEDAPPTHPQVMQMSSRAERRGGVGEGRASCAVSAVALCFPTVHSSSQVMAGFGSGHVLSRYCLNLLRWVPGVSLLRAIWIPGVTVDSHSERLLNDSLSLPCLRSRDVPFRP